MPFDNFLLIIEDGLGNEITRSLSIFNFKQKEEKIVIQRSKQFF